jgi:ATP-dependent RNA helicase DeaD
VTPSQVVGAIARTADVPGSALGRIVIEERRTLVDVPEEFAGRVLSHAGGYRLGKGVAHISRA